MKNNFLTRYKDYFKVRENRYEILRMNQRLDETLEDYVEHFQFNYKISTSWNMDGESLKLFLLEGVREELIESLNILIVARHVYQLTYEEVM